MGRFRGEGEITLFTCHVGGYTYVSWKRESPGRGSFGNLNLAGNKPRHSDSNNFCKPLSFPVCSLLACVHVFTSKAIVPDLYDRPLTLSVLVHQHQAENTQGRVWAKPNVALCHSVAATSNRNTLQQITSISALFQAVSQSHKVCCRLFFFLFFLFTQCSGSKFCELLFYQKTSDGYNGRSAANTTISSACLAFVHSLAPYSVSQMCSSFWEEISLWIKTALSNTWKHVFVFVLLLFFSVLNSEFR